MTYPNTSTQPRQQSTKRSWMAPVIAGVAGLAFGGLAATGITMTTTGTQGGSQAECVAAIGHADQAIDLYSGAFTDAADAIDSYMAYDYSAMDGSTANINAAADELGPILTDYNLAADKCVGAK